MLIVDVLETGSLHEAAALVAREQVAARSRRVWLPVAYTDPAHCHMALDELLTDGYAGVVARDEHGPVGVMCARATDSVGFVPAHGLAVDVDRVDPTAVVVALLAELVPVLLRNGAERFTVDHVARDPLGVALSDAGFGRGSVFATQPAQRTAATPDVDVRIGTADDLDAIAALSQIELAHRSTAPIYGSSRPRTSTQAREHHARLLDGGAVHFLARRDARDVALVTVELTSPAPRLCADAQPYIGPTATHPAARGRGVGAALVRAALDWADASGYETVSVDFDAANPLSRPFWLGLGFEPTGYRARRTIDASYTTLARTGG